ncbi:MAG: YdeI/OmpD-associated family protein [Gemmatimonadaceae bacterium]|nr:YdeI/OmpD-associated family protein [Gemmatimonadaceae bacterium]
MSPNVTESYKRVEARDRTRWRAWLEKNHARSPGIWLVFYKKTSGKPTVRYDEAVEEALCYGWIDSLMKPVDEQRYRQLFTPRKRKSRWSKPNKERVACMIAAGLMTDVGMEKVQAAKRDGSWAHMEPADSLVVPPDLRKALSVDKRARDGFEQMPPGRKRQLLGWIHDAKRPETRQRRIAQAVEVAAGARTI